MPLYRDEGIFEFIFPPFLLHSSSSNRRQNPRLASVLCRRPGKDRAFLAGLGARLLLDMAEVKPEEIAAQPPMDQLQGFEYCIDSNPSWGEAAVLGFQHYALSLGTAVMIPTLLVPLMGGTDDDKARVVQTLLFVTGINTLIQTLFGTRLPTVIGGSYAFVIPIISIIRDSSLTQITDDHERFLQTMRAIQGALMVSSSIQIILGYSQLWGIFSRFFSPLGMVPEEVNCDVNVVSWRERRVRAWILVNVDDESVWSVLTDYERLADFIPNLIYCIRGEYGWSREGYNVRYTGTSRLAWSWTFRNFRTLSGRGSLGM